MGNKLIRGSFIIFLGNIIFRLGGYIYRFLMASLLGPALYGVLGITLPFQGIFQTLSAGGLPPAIAKYVAEYEATDQKDLARQTIYTSLKIMFFLGCFFGVIMVVWAAPWLANVYLQKPETLIPLQIVGFITPFSVIVGAFRGAFQGVYKMEYILYTRAVEQICMILFAVGFVLIGFSVVGALWGTVLGFALSAVVAVYIFKFHMGKYMPKGTDGFKMSAREELKLAGMLIKFAIPVIITAIAEMGIYNICTLVMGAFLTTEAIGFFAAADPISRLPLIISVSIATTILPASSEAFSSGNKRSLEKYVNESYKFSLVFVIPMCIGIAAFASPILQLLYFTNPSYVAGASSLAILSIGMTFYSLFSISTSIIQGIGNPRVPMYILVLGAILCLILNWWLVPIMGIAGGALATTLACLAMMIPVMYFAFRLTGTSPQLRPITKMVIAAIVMGIIALIIPKTIIGLIVGIVCCPFVYLGALILFGFFTKEDITALREYAIKFKGLSGIINKLLDGIEKIESKRPKIKS